MPPSWLLPILLFYSVRIPTSVHAQTLEYTLVHVCKKKKKWGGVKAKLLSSDWPLFLLHSSSALLFSLKEIMTERERLGQTCVDCILEENSVCVSEGTRQRLFLRKIKHDAGSKIQEITGRRHSHLSVLHVVTADRPPRPDSLLH